MNLLELNYGEYGWPPRHCKVNRQLVFSYIFFLASVTMYHRDSYLYSLDSICFDFLWLQTGFVMICFTHSHEKKKIYFSLSAHLTLQLGPVQPIELIFWSFNSKWIIKSLHKDFLSIYYGLVGTQDPTVWIIHIFFQGLIITRAIFINKWAAGCSVLS